MSLGIVVSASDTHAWHQVSEARLVAAKRYQQHVEIILDRVTFGWDTRCYSLIQSKKNLSIKTLMLTDLMVESAILDSGEKRYSQEQEP